MRVCSICLKCHEDSVAICEVDESHGSLTKAREGSCLIVDGYRIDSRTGSAFPVELYRATQLASEKSVLIRFLKPRDSVSKLESDLRAVVSLDHPNLTRVFEFGEIPGGEFYVVLEDVPGNKNLRDGKALPISEGEAIKIVRQISEALEALHGVGVVHGAVNPSNIYYTNSGNGDFTVKLQNFGGVMGQVAGSEVAIEALTYLSPEQLTDGEIDFRSDLYSLAAVFYKLLLGRAPVERPDPDAILNYAFNESDVWDLHIDLRALLAHILRQSFQHRLELRPPTTDNFVRQLRYLELIAGRSTNGANATLIDHSVEERAPYQPQILTTLADDLSEEIGPEFATVQGSQFHAVGTPTPDSRPGNGKSRIESKKGASSDKQLVSGDHGILKMDLDEEFEEEEFNVGSNGREEAGTETPSDPGIRAVVNGNPIVAHPQKRGSRGLMYAAGLLVSAVMGAVLTVAILGLQDGANPETTVPEADSPVVNERETSIGEPKEFAEGTDSAPATEIESKTPVLEELDARFAAASASRNLSRPTTAKNRAAQAAKKVKAKSRNKRNGRATVKQQDKKVEAPQSETRSGVFEDVIIYY